MNREMSTAGVLGEAQTLYKRGEFQGVVDLVDACWDSLGALAPTKDAADLCRITMLSHYRLAAGGRFHEHYLSGYLWRVRALIRAAASGWVAGVVALAQTEALRIQSAENHGVPTSSPEYRVVPQARDILSELEPYADPDDPGDSPLQPSPRVVGRLLYEKRGFLHYLAGHYEAALADYDKALEFTGKDERAELKVLGGRASVLYAAGDPTQRQTALALLKEVERRCEAGGYNEIARISAQNIERVADGREDLVPYETL